MVTPEMQAELTQLNDAVADALKAREDWLDSNMTAAAKFKVGDEVFDHDGRKIGVVTELLRRYSHNIVDASLTVDYRFDNGDNSSRMSLSEWEMLTREEAANALIKKAERLRNADM